MKNLIVLFLTVVTLFTGSAFNAIAQKPKGPNVAEIQDAKSIGKPTAANPMNARFTVSANTVRYHTYRMTAGERIRIELVGDGDTDLDLYVYSSDGVLIDSRETFSDCEISNIVANRSGTVTIKVVNRGGVYNNYDLSIF